MLHQLPLAYLDPGTGSLIVQTLIAAVLGSLLVFRNFWRHMIQRVKGVFQGKPDEASTDDPTP